MFVTLAQVPHARHGAELVEHGVEARLARVERARPRESGSASEPKTIARVGQACWHAVCTSSPRSGAPVGAAAISRLADALHAERALLHDAALAHRDVGVVRRSCSVSLSSCVCSRTS